MSTAIKQTFKATSLETVATEDGRLTLSGLPVKAGERVEVIVIPMERTPSALADAIRQRLNGSILQDDDPFGPAAPLEDWDAAQ